MKPQHLLLAAILLSACSGREDTQDSDSAGSPATASTSQDAAPPPAPKAVEALHMYMLDCGLIDISDLDGFSSTGDYAGLADTFADTCWLLRHPKGNFLWDLGLPTGLVGNGEQTNDVFTLSMERTISDQLVEIGLFTSDIDMISISHSHFDHAGQADQFPAAKWIVHKDEYAAMFPDGSGSVSEEGDTENGGVDADHPFAVFAMLEREEFTGEYDVFADGSVTIIPTPGHTAGHTSLLVNLPETGPILLTGDLYHRSESRTLKRVPRFNFDEQQTLASMEAFEARASATGARVIIQHDADDMADLPKAPSPIR